MSFLKTSENIGIYCLANDHVLDWMIAFLESIRTYEKERRVIVIPFDDNINKLSKLAQKYNFEFFQDSTLKELDKIGEDVHSLKDSNIHRFRTFASFWGPLETFVFFDSDIVILDNLEELFQAFLDSNCDFMSYYKGHFEYVYKEGKFKEKMLKEYEANGFNAGSFISSKGILKLEDFKQLSIEVASIKCYFADGCIVQPFFNYCVDRKRLKTKTIVEVIPNLASEWAKYEPIEKVNNIYKINGKKLIYTHWAGMKHGPYMPNRKLFLEYRLKSKFWLSRFQYRLFDWFKFKFLSLKNRLYKLFKRLLSIQNYQLND